MVGALHSTGLQVVLDEVYNHTAASGQGGKSVLDKIVPGYYQRLNAVGNVETSTCCQNIATEHDVAEKLMVDSVVLWAKEYKVDGFRFDLMGHHSKANMLAVRAALDELTLEDDGVDGSSVYLYGEGWNFGEVSNNALFEQATQGQLGGTGIGTFNDRLRDGVHGGSPVSGDSKFEQGFGTGLAGEPNGMPTRDGIRNLGQQTDLVKLGLAGNLRDFEFTGYDGVLKSGAEVDYNGSPAGYADQPDEVINYVDAHDNETLYDLGVFKLPTDTSMADRVRMNTLSLATVTFSQTPSFWHAGTELLRSKSLDRNSYNSGDWFNRIDWTGQESTFGSGLPMESDNADHWEFMAPLLADPALKPGAPDIAAAEASALDLLRVRSSVDLLQLGSAELIEQKVSFPNSGTEATDGLIMMLIDDLVGDDVDPGARGCARRVQRLARGDHRAGRRARWPRLRTQRRSGRRCRHGREGHGMGCRVRHAHAPGAHRCGTRRRAGARRRRDPHARSAEQGCREGGKRHQGGGPGHGARRLAAGGHGVDPRRRRGRRDRAHRRRRPWPVQREAAEASRGSALGADRLRRCRRVRRVAVGPGAGGAVVSRGATGAP